MFEDLHSQQLLEDNQTATTQEQGLLPDSPVGQSFLHYFHHGWGFIYEVLKQGNAPSGKQKSAIP
ncbi:MAG: hypothetical protein KME49_22865 [Brasilonema octagenarum HA4186-MV1]|nr:hypothetical protein [Brasilonema octagenarum HA4186-MV1]